MRAIEVYQPELRTIATAVDLLREQVFERERGSLFTPGIPIWTSEALAEVKQRFIDQPDESDETFEQKLKKQLAGANDAAIQLMAEALYVYCMVAEQMHGKTKIRNVRAILDWMRHPAAVPEPLLAAAEQGLTNTGTFYLTNKPFQLAFLINVAAAWNALPTSEEERKTMDPWANDLSTQRERLLADPWAFKEFVLRVPCDRAIPMRMALLHFVFPDAFEIIISATHKRLICKAFTHIAPDEQDEDRRMQAIKRTLPPGPQSIWTFYRPEVVKQWEPEKLPPPQPPPDATRKPTPTKPAVLDATVVVRDLDVVAASLCIEPGWLHEVCDVLAERKQIIFHGSPGTGKTLIAQRVADCVASPGCTHFVQFHPAYSYEDFIEGLRPSIGSRAGEFEVRHGPLRQIAKQAAADDTRTHVLVIDEINRANLARVLGELVFLLEYRERKVTLPYSGDMFSLPSNLLIIGTMNTADRSIALIDAAIRRRFAFFRLAPDSPPVVGVLAAWLDANASAMGWVDALVSRANQIIQSPDHAIGPSFFMRPDLSDAVLERVWRRQVMPYLDEFLHDAPETRRRLELASLLAEVRAEREDTAA